MNAVRAIVLTALLVFVSSLDIDAQSPLDGVKAVEAIDLPASEFDGSLTLNVKSRKGGRAVTVFPAGGDGQLYAVEIQIRDSGLEVEYRAPRVDYVLYSLGDDTKLATTSLTVDSNVAGIKIVQDRYRLRFTGVGGKPLFEFDNVTVPPLTEGAEVTVYTNGNTRVERLRQNFTSYPRPVVCTAPLEDVNTIDAPHAGQWAYLDRMMPEGSVIIGGKYRVALVPDSNNPGDYIIVYLSGATVDSEFWQPGYVKGRLKATPFVDHFDAEWLDSRRQTLSDEVSATFETPEILRIDLPCSTHSSAFTAPTTFERGKTKT